MTPSVESPSGELAVVWSGGALLPPRPEMSSLTMFGGARDLPDEPEASPTSAPRLSRCNRLKAAWCAYRRAHPPAAGRCACGCGQALVGLNPNGRRLYNAGHQHMNTTTLLRRLRSAGVDLRKQIPHA